MIYDREILEALEDLSAMPFEGIVFRHMFFGFLPDRENSRGARWNPPETPAIYTSMDRETAIAEADYYVNSQPSRPWPGRRVYRIALVLRSVLDLSAWDVLTKLGLTHDSFASTEHLQSQLIGGAAEWLKHDGILVPSARASGNNLVVYPNRQAANYKFEVLDFEDITAPDESA